MEQSPANYRIKADNNFKSNSYPLGLEKYVGPEATLFSVL
jgi:hypothetical protein